MCSSCAPHVLACRFCFECISNWTSTENRCPYCKERFIVITKKRLAPDAGRDEDEEGPVKKLKGEVLETCIVEDRKQVWMHGAPMHWMHGAMMH